MVVEPREAAAPSHPWLRRLPLAFIPGAVTTTLLEDVVDNLLSAMQRHGHALQQAPDDTTGVLITTAPFGEAISWRHSVLFTARRRFGVHHSPVVVTLVHATTEAFENHLDRLARGTRTKSPDPDLYEFPGLASRAFRVLHEQGKRGGPILALERVVQAQTKSVRVILIVGDESPRTAYHFDLAGAHPTTDGRDIESFYEDLALRITTAASTDEITEHELADAIPQSVWRSLATPAAMRTASEQLGRRNFFTDPVVIADLVTVPVASQAIASQYSEGCFATWDPAIEGLVSTVTGSARPIHKAQVTQDDLAVIVGLREDGRGAVFRPVEGRPPTPPSSEAVEMMAMDGNLPRVSLRGDVEAPVVRSKLHGHRGVAAYDPRKVEFVPLDPAYYDYPVSCASDAQARAVTSAFARSSALRDADDPRTIAFTVLPGHGQVAAEKWVEGKAPFQVIWEAIDEGSLDVVSAVPQGRMRYSQSGDGQMTLETEE